MPPLPIQAQAASDLESNMKLPNKNNKNPQVNKKKETKADKAKITPNKQHVNGTSTAASYAAVAGMYWFIKRPLILINFTNFFFFLEKQLYYFRFPFQLPLNNHN